jgi:hypothetical protein
MIVSLISIINYLLPNPMTYIYQNNNTNFAHSIFIKAVSLNAYLLIVIFAVNKQF